MQNHLTEVCEERIIVTQIENRSNNYAQFFWNILGLMSKWIAFEDWKKYCLKTSWSIGLKSFKFSYAKSIFKPSFENGLYYKASAEIIHK